MRPGELEGWLGMTDAAGEGAGGPNPPTVIRVAVTALSAPVPTQVTRLPKASQRQAGGGNIANPRPNPDGAPGGDQWRC